MTDIAVVSSIIKRAMSSDLILDSDSERCVSSSAGGKGHNLWELGKRLQQCDVPPWFCITTHAFSLFTEVRI